MGKAFDRRGGAWAGTAGRTLGLPAMLALATSLGAGVASAEYLLQPGDVLRVVVPGMADLNAAVAIDNDGMVRLPPFGAVRAAGDDLAAVETALRASAAQMVTRRYDAAGVASFVPIPAEDLRLSIDTFRPVHVYGVVRSPGAIAFRPGLTIRAALAVAGGSSSTAGVAQGNDGLMALRAQADFTTVTLERARLRAEIWRLEASLGLSATDAPPTAADLGVSDAAADALLDIQRDLLATLNAQRSAEVAFLESAVKQTDERIAILTEQAARQSDAVAADEEETRRVTRLLERGVVPNDRMLDVRRASVLSATRLLEVQNDLERVRFDRIRFAADLETNESRRRERLLGELGATQARLEAAAVRLTAARDTLTLSGLAPTPLTSAAPPTVLVHRGVAPLVVVLAPQLDELLEPGDVVEVSMPLATD